MEENHPALEPQDLQTPTKEELGSESKQTSSSKSRPVSSRCTRSQVAPDWTVQEMLIFVSQIAAIDADFSRSLPSPQKWKMIVDNCNALGASRSLNQCRKKWESLIADYKKINDWETQPGNDSYLSLESERKIEYGLPVIDGELFKSINELLKAQEEQSGSEPESESESAADKLNAIIDSDSKKPKRRRGRPRKKVKESAGEMAVEDIALELQRKTELVHAIPEGDLNENKDDNLNESKNPEIILVTPTGDLNEKKDSALNEPKNPEIIPAMPRGELNENKDNALNESKSPGPKKQKRGRGRPKKKVEEEEMTVEDEEDEMIVKLRENIELVHSILRGDHKENKDNASNQSKNPVMLQTELVRRQGNQLIDVLGSLVSTLDQLSDRVKESV